ncbi:LuxR C-terminal-related transcriptional regulator [Anaerocolumna xylanovorans]|uniref:Regulatory protein, luxR family n=1 Tax=Anaerocolumna xylanovorans DSM 12503 TaxID=1121345 RepID=A0A1M7YN70_9FIRM|nr:response regulator transcription factor [Anaerocolumna xylanovorans]SHO54084.1 regulatory protein, luxR family [Anaerocolumna xylanovorans DSM 12503]
METDYEVLLRQNEYETNEKVSRAARIVLYFEFLVAILCWLKIFDLQTSIVNGTIAATVIPLLLPTVMIDILHIDEAWVKYLLIGSVTAVTGIYYIFLTFQVLLLFILPTIIAALYLEKKILYFCYGSTVLTILLSHFVTGFYLLQPWIEPFKGVKVIMLYGAFPRVLEYLCIAVIINILVSHCRKYISSFSSFQEEKKENTIPQPAEDTGILHTMTEREREVCRLISYGCTNAQIAKQLYLSVGTVKNYVSVIYEKTGIKDRTALALKLNRYFNENDPGHM